MKAGVLILCTSIFSCVSAQDYDPPEDYYDTTVGLSGEALKNALHDIIDGQNIVSYSAIRNAMAELDKDPDNPSNILLLYSGDSVPYSSSGWNREHSWPRSYGADSGPAFSDAHHLFPADEQANSDRSNFAFDDLEVSSAMFNAPDTRVNRSLRLVEPRDEDKGRIARAMFYMETRYDSSNSTGDFLLSDQPIDYLNQLGKLSALLRWNRNFPPDEREKRRNDMIYDGFISNNAAILQSNRNPFVDYPDLVDAVYTAQQYVTWSSWKYQYFQLVDLNEASITGPDVDTDGDRLLNLMEFALQTDPLQATISDLPAVDRATGVNYFSFNRIKEPEESNLTYRVEFSTDPLDRNSWQDIPFSPRDLLSADRGFFDFASLIHQHDDQQSGKAFYRLVVEQNLDSSDPVETEFDPYAHASNGVHLFTYLEPYATAWKNSPWMRFINHSQAPWFYHPSHAWIHSESLSENEIWLFDPSLGWMFTNAQIYPFLYHPAAGWLYYDRGTVSPDRMFFLPATGQNISEINLINNLSN